MKKKTFLNKITMWLCALVMVFGMFGSAVEVCADSGNILLARNFFIVHGEEMRGDNSLVDIAGVDMSGYDYHLVTDTDDGYYLFLSNQKPYFIISENSSTYFSIDAPNISGKLYKSSDGVNWVYANSQFSCKPYSGNGVIVEDDYTLRWNYPARNNKYYHFNFDLAFDTGDIFLSAKKSQYNSDVGYLKNLSLKTLRVDGVQDLTYKFTFSPISTTGIDITTGDYVVRLYGQLAYYKTDAGVLSSKADNMVHVGDYEISNNSIQFGLQSAWDAVTAESEVLDTWTLAQLGLTRADTLYLQLYNKTTGEYGGYVRFTNTSNFIGKDDTVTTIMPDGETDNGGYTGEIVDGSTGSGESLENAEQNADKTPVDIWSGFDSFSSILDGISETLGNVSGAFDSIFSFLPSYCRTLFGLSVSAILLIALVKFIRG